MYATPSSDAHGTILVCVQRNSFGEMVAEYTSSVAGEVTGLRSDAMSEPGNPLAFILPRAGALAAPVTGFTPSHFLGANPNRSIDGFCAQSRCGDLPAKVRRRPYG